LSEFLNTYWQKSNNHQTHAGGRLVLFDAAAGGDDAANSHQANQVARRREEFRAKLATQSKVNEIVPEAHSGGWCQKCPHAGYCGAVKRRGEEVGEG
jgi:hypothetical protein